MTKLQQIRARCLECVDGPGEVRACAFFGCPLWPFRLGTNPNIDPERVARLGFTPKPKPGCGIDPATLRSWSWRNFPPGTVDAPDPQLMTTVELGALIPRRLMPGQALKRDDWDSANGIVARKRRLAEERAEIENAPSTGE